MSRICWLLPALLFFGCGGTVASPAIPLSGEDRATAHGALREHFTGIHDHEFEISAPLRARLDASLETLAGQFETPPELTALLVNNPDADAGCIAGGQMFLSIGLLAFVQHPEELTGILALALTACGEASEDWRRRARNRLPAADADDPLMILYRDLRLQEQAPLYRQLVRTGCGRGRDCRRLAADRLPGDGTAHLERLLNRIAASWPEAAVFHRFGAVDGGATDPVDDDSTFAELVLPLAELRETFTYLRVARHALLVGDILEAYRANLKASTIGTDSWLPLIMQVRLDLANVHPEYTLRDLRQLRDQYRDRPSIELYRGIAQWQMQRVGEGRPYLEASIEGRPTVSAHYYLGRILALLGERERAIEHLRIAAQGGELHPYAEDAAARLADLDDDGTRQPRR